MAPTRSVTEALAAISSGRRSADSLEGDHLDFKTDKSNDKETGQDLAEAAVCFANAAGGTIILGVRDRDVGPSAFVGTHISTAVLRSKIHDLTEPPMLVEVEEVDWQGVRLVQVSVPQGLDVYSTRKGLVLRRWNDQCLPLRPNDVSRLDDERRGADWSSAPSGRPLGDVDPEAMHRLRQLLSQASSASRRHLSTSSDIDVARALKLVASDASLTRAGEILLCREATCASEDILVYQYRATPGGEAKVARRWGSPLITAFTEAIDVITARSGVTPVNTSGGQVIQVEDFPLAAVREALANALLHGDYRERRAVQVEHSPSALRVQSPGPLVAGITPANILTAGSRARFAALTSAFRQLGLAEELGQGVDRMFREMVRSGRRTPEVQVIEGGDHANTVVTLRGGPPNARVARFVAELPEAERDDTDALLIIQLLCERRSVTARDVAPVVQRDITSTEEVLRRLATGDAEVLEPTAGTRARRNPNYRLRGHALAALGPAVTYHRRNASDADRKIIDHLREYSSINNSTIQRIFDVDVYQARDILRDLVGREVLTRTSEQTRGTAVRYGKGAKFPEKRPGSRTPT
ncbi:ATP-dependent DNA helicase RecG [Kineococcus radiotolerans]|uniref:ATP-dependent DNA helicase RecG n=1 Tax=Kineococcus radiotolerans TaxID=131568 RepID=A0A7W4XWN2_KINRA|nr:RNA-binding domain-containing protein [Kineococcus radiotolerans]MBB2901053.1 ATP-dependent DNA helicase RecG [Kineococcus radiotolerans]